MFCVDLENKRIGSLNSNDHIEYIIENTDFHLFGDAEFFMVAERKELYTNIEEFFASCRNKFGKQTRCGPLWIDWKKRRWDHVHHVKENTLSNIFLTKYGDFVAAPHNHFDHKWFEYLTKKDIWVTQPLQLLFPIDENIDATVKTITVIDNGNENVTLAVSELYYYYFCFATS